MEWGSSESQVLPFSNPQASLGNGGFASGVAQYPEPLSRHSASFPSFSATGFLALKARLEPKRALQTPGVPMVWALCCSAFQLCGVWTSWAGPLLLQGRRLGCYFGSDLNIDIWWHWGQGPRWLGVRWPALLMYFGSLFPLLSVFLEKTNSEVKKQLMVFRMMLLNKVNIGNMFCR